MARIQADHRQAALLQLMPVPGRQRAAFQANALHMRRSRVDDCRNGFRRRGAFATPERLPVLVDNTDGCLLQRYIQPDILLHEDTLRWLPVWARSHQTLLYRRRAPGPD